MALNPSLGALLNGLIIGFSIAAPVGPIGLLCIRRSLAQGMAAGLATGLGAATADAAYGAVAAFGLTAVSSALVGAGTWLALVGGAFLCYLGVSTFRSPPRAEAAAERGPSLLRAYASTVLLTLSNPATILSFVAIFAGLGLGAQADFAAAAAMVAGVFLGSALWWLLLSGVSGGLRTRVQPAWVVGINRASGTLLLGFGIIALGRAVWTALRT
jgi:threonine/homoserine/homoserine lactone efflux protein